MPSPVSFLSLAVALVAVRRSQIEIYSRQLHDHFSNGAGECETLGQCPAISERELLYGQTPPSVSLSYHQTVAAARMRILELELVAAVSAVGQWINVAIQNLKFPNSGAAVLPA